MRNNVEASGNQLLDALKRSARRSVLDHMDRVSLELKDTLYQDNQPIENIYFPVKGVVSWIQSVGNGKSIEIATIGSEGFVGVPVLLGSDRTQGKAFPQIPGEAFRISAEKFRVLLAASASSVAILNRYVQALLVQIAQENVCNTFHSVEQRCARWLLMTHDRVRESSFYLTQEFLALMLGVRRSGVNETARRLQRTGAIRYARGLITIVSRESLEAASCRCYGIVRDEFHRMQHDLHAGPIRRLNASSP
jgi:CRP-like cAMP-binding protein